MKPKYKVGDEVVFYKNPFLFDPDFCKIEGMIGKIIVIERIGTGIWYLLSGSGYRFLQSWLRPSVGLMLKDIYDTHG